METELFVHFAEIAGVFVGFGALISLRSARVTDAHDVVYLRSVLGLGVWVVVSALVPIAVARYGVSGHRLWLVCASVALVVFAVVLALLSRTPEFRELDRSPELVDRVFPIVGLPLHLAIAGSLLLTILGVRTAIDEALYVTALTAGVVFAGYTLLACVLSQKQEPGPTASG